MPDAPAADRRAVLRAGALALAGAAGCATDGNGTGAGSTDDRTETEADSAADETGTGRDAAGDGTAGAARTDDEAGGGDGDDSGETATAGEDGGGGETATTDATTPEYDLREANVTAVEFERADGAFRFSVTLYHDDDGEEGYADWWQVEPLDGDRLGRRALAHPHSTEPFTRSETIDVSEEITCVVVRGHDQTHGYGGRAMLVNLDSGETEGVEQGSEPSSFDESDCP